MSESPVLDEAGHPSFDTSVAHQARVYDYLLGGKDNFAADRAAAEAMIEAYPTMLEMVQANRAFLRRAVRFLAGEAGIRQFLDVGTGIPTVANTHQVAQDVAPESRVVYVDYDPVVLAHARALLTSDRRGATDYIDSDLRDVPAVLENAGRTLDLTAPVAVIILLTLHAIPGSDDPWGVVGGLMRGVPDGSYLVITHPASDIQPEWIDKLGSRLNPLSYQQYTARDRDDVGRFFDGTTLVEPGLVQVHQWRPETEPTGSFSLWSGVGRK